ncbi:MAG TPA: alpha/beta hydrolase, partial [Acidimicrobiales bacterium]|nr:alpha/beta hydrolase [Acidimicrobiales bacterium]
MSIGGETKKVAARGAEITYDIRSGGSPTVAFIHGWGCRRRYWNGVIDALGEPGTFVSIDLPAHGDSTAGDAPWTMERFGQDVLDVLDAEGLSDVVLVGHSMGAAVALEAARLAREKVRSIVAVDALSHLSTYQAQPEAAVTPMIESMRADLPASV